MNGPFVVNWDSKMLPDILILETVDRLPVLFSVNNEDNLLSVLKLTSATSRNAADEFIMC